MKSWLTTIETADPGCVSARRLPARRGRPALAVQDVQCPFRVKVADAELLAWEVSVWSGRGVEICSESVGTFRGARAVASSGLSLSRVVRVLSDPHPLGRIPWESPDVAGGAGRGHGRVVELDNGEGVGVLGDCKPFQRVFAIESSQSDPADAPVGG